MADTLQPNITPYSIIQCVEQRIVAGSEFDGTAPRLATVAFAPFFDDTDGIIRMKQSTVPANVEGDQGGLFTFTTDRPMVITNILGNLGSSIAWTLSLVTVLGTAKAAQIDGATGRYINHLANQRFTLFPGEQVQFTTTGASAAMWLRVYFRTQPENQ